MNNREAVQELTDFLSTPVPPKAVQRWKVTRDDTVEFFETAWNKNHGKMLDEVKALVGCERPLCTTHTSHGYRKVQSA